MNPSLPLNVPGSRWDAMCQRLEPLLGDVRAALGPAWHEKLEAYFAETDLAVAAAARSGAARRDWRVIQFHPAGRRLDENGEVLACAPSWGEALSAVLAACKYHRRLPTKVFYDEGSQVLRLAAGDDLLVSISPIQYRALPPRLRQRALSTISGLRKFATPSEEFLKRVRKWPGMAKAVGDDRTWHEMATFRNEMVHLPIPCEWLQSARLLCAACGFADPSMTRVQEVAAAALSAPTWNHIALAGSVESTTPPWYVGSDGEAFSFYVDAIDAMADLLTRAAREWTSDWEAIELGKGHCHGGPDYTPNYCLSRPSGTKGSERSAIDEVAARQLLLMPQPARETVEAALPAPGRSAEDVARFFGVGLPADARSLMLDESAAETLIVQDGPWRFTRDGDLAAERTHVWVHKLDRAGNAAWSAAVPAYKGLLLRHRESGFLVLCADYDGGHPVAVIDGMSPVAVAQVRASLRDTRGDLMEYRVEGRRRQDKADFEELLTRALDAAKA